MARIDVLGGLAALRSHAFCMIVCAPTNQVGHSSLP